MNTNIKPCPDCGGSGKGHSQLVATGATIVHIPAGPCIRCDGRGETLISDQQLDDEFPRTEE